MAQQAFLQLTCRFMPHWPSAEAKNDDMTAQAVLWQQERPALPGAASVRPQVGPVVTLVGSPATAHSRRSNSSLVVKLPCCQGCGSSFEPKPACAVPLPLSYPVQIVQAWLVRQECICNAYNSHIKLLQRHRSSKTGVVLPRRAAPVY